jgi:hypothetical protein
MRSLDRCDVNPKPSIIGLVSAVRVDLSLNPRDSRFVSVDVVRVRVTQAACPIAVSRHPPIEAIVALTVPARGYICVYIGAAKVSISNVSQRDRVMRLT